MFGVLSDLAKIVVLPVATAVKVVEPVVRTVTEPVANVVEDVCDSLTGKR